MNGIGARIRAVRVSQQKSLSEVASRARISAATLSRIETDKQGVGIALFLLLAKVLRVNPGELLEDDNNGRDNEPLVGRLAALRATERARFWNDLAAARREERNQRDPSGNVSAQIEELLAHIDYMRQEIEAVRHNITARRTRAVERRRV